MHYTLRHLLTPWGRVLLEKLTGLQLVKKFPEIYGTRKFIAAFASVHHLSLFWANFSVWTFRINIRFYGEELLAPRPTTKLEDHPLSAVCDCLLNIFAVPPYWRHSSILNLRTRHAVVTGPHLSRHLIQQYEKFYNRPSEINTVGYICAVTSVVEMVAWKTF